MSQVADAFAAAGLQATVVGLLNSAMQVGQLLSTLGWGLVVGRRSLRSEYVSGVGGVDGRVVTAGVAPLAFVRGEASW